MLTKARSALLLFVLSFFLALQAHAATTYVWTGAASNLWSNSGNWSPVGVPADGDGILFPVTSSNRANQNDLPTTVALRDIAFSGSGYTLSGNSVVVTNSVSSSNYTPTINLGIDIQANAVSMGNVRIAGPLSGTGPVTLNNGWVYLSGTHTYSGTITSTCVQTCGSLMLNGGSLPSATVVNGGGLFGNGTIGNLNSNSTLQVSGNDNATPIGILNTGNYSQLSTLYLDINGATAGTGYDQLNVTGTVTLNSRQLSLTMAANFTPALGQVFTLIQNDGTDAVSGTFSGMAEGATITLNGAQFRLSYVGGTGNDVTLTCILSPKVWTGAVNANWSNAGNWQGGVAPVAGDALYFPSGASNLTNTNDFTAGTSFSSVTFGASGYTVNGNEVVITSSFTSPNAITTVNLPINVQANTVTMGGLRMSGALSGSGTITMNAGSVYLGGSHLFSGTINIACGTQTCASLFLNGASLSLATVINSSGLYGNGTIGNLTNSATLSPSGNDNATPVGTINTGNFTLNNTLFLDLNGTVAGVSHDQVNVSGTVSLNSRQLSLTMGSTFTPALGQVFTILQNDGTDAITGTFSGLAEGATVTLNGAQFRISYVGGTGNDVTLTCILSPKVWSGAVNANWSNAGNWQGGVAPTTGDTLLFPAGAANTTMVNDLAAGTSIAGISFTGSGYSMSGNGIVLTGSFTSPANVGTVVVSFPIDVQNNSVALGGLKLSGALSGTGPISLKDNGVYLSGSHTYSGTITITCGTQYCGSLSLNGASLPSATFVNNSGLYGNGTIGALSGFSIIQVGANDFGGGANILQTGNLSLQGTLYVDINGPAAGTGYDQLRVAGTVTLGNRTLNLTMGAFTPALGQVITLIDNDGTDAVTGTFSGLAEGTTITLNAYQFKLSYAGGDGNDVTLTSLNGKPASTVTLSSGANPSTAGTSVTFTATVVGTNPTGTVTFFDGNTSIGSAALSSGSATFSTSGLAAGTHSITAQYSGDTNNGAGSSSAVSQVVDKRVSTTVVTTASATVEYKASTSFRATVTSSGSPTGTVVFKDGATTLGTVSLSGGIANFGTSTLSLGSHTITGDYAGDAINTASSGSVTVTVQDTIAPTASITSAPAAATSSTSATVTFTGSDSGSGVASFQCSLDGGAPAACTSPFTIGNLSQGSHTLNVRAIDAAGNIGSPVSATWVVDTTSPETTILTGPPTPTNNTNASLTFSGTDGQTSIAAYQCDLDSGGFSTCTSPRSYTALAAGVHTFSVRAVDAAGNVDPTPATHTWTIDTTAPTLAITTKPVITSANQASYQLLGTCSDDGRTINVQVESVSATAVCGNNSSGGWKTAGLDATGLAQGPIALSASMSDAAGNSTTVNAATTKDSVGPTLTIDALNPVSAANKAAYSFSGGCEAGGGTVSYTVTSGANVAGSATCTSGAFAVSSLNLTTLSDGTVAVQVKQADANGNNTTTNGSVVKDTVVPTIGLTSTPTINSANAASYGVEGTCSEGGRTVTVTAGAVSATVACGNNGAGVFQLAMDVSSLADGSVTVGASITDAAGNSGTASTSVVKDTVAGAPTIVAPANGGTSALATTISGSGAEPGATVKVKESTTTLCTVTALAGGTWSCDVTVSAGTHTIEATQTDTAGNTSAASASVTFTAKSSTSVSLSQDSASTVYGSNVTFTASLTGSPTGTVTFNADGSTLAGCSAVTVSSGTATCTTATLGAGSHAVSAQYNGDASYFAATSSTITHGVTKATQAITMDTLRDRGYNESPFTLAATGGASGNAVTFSSSTTGVCTVSGTTVNLVATGTCTILADQAGDANYTAAPQVTRSFVVSKAPQAITFGGFVDKTYGDAPFVASATGGSSGNPVTFTSQATAVCTTSGTNGTTITIIAAGTCSVSLFQSGNANYQDSQTIQSFNVAKAAQSIAFGSLSDRMLGTAPFTVSATGGASGNAVTFASTTSTTCSTSGTNGSTVTMLMPGTCSITASQAGNGNYAAAPSVTQSFTVNGVLVKAEMDYRSDFNSDGKQDIAWVHTDGSSVSWLMNANTQIGGARWLSAGSGWTLKLVGDLDGDGDSDLIWQHADGRVASWILQNNAQVGGALMLTAGSGWTPMFLGDFNGDGKHDIVYRHPDGRVGIWLMNGATQIGAGVVQPGADWTPRFVADFNGDGRADILWEHDDGRVAVWLMNGVNQVGGGLLLAAGSGYKARLVGDFNGDGKADILWEHADGRSAMWLMDGVTQVGGSVLLNAGSGWRATRVGDLDGDGKADIVWQHVDGSVAAWIMRGATQLYGVRLADAATGWTVKRIADFSGDGRADVLMQNTSGEVRMWLLNGTTFATGSIMPAASGWTTAP